MLFNCNAVLSHFNFTEKLQILRCGYVIYFQCDFDNILFICATI